MRSSFQSSRIQSVHPARSGWIRVCVCVYVCVSVCVCEKRRARVSVCEWGGVLLRLFWLSCGWIFWQGDNDTRCSYPFSFLGSRQKKGIKYLQIIKDSLSFSRERKMEGRAGLTSPIWGCKCDDCDAFWKGFLIWQMTKVRGQFHRHFTTVEYVWIMHLASINY